MSRSRSPAAGLFAKFSSQRVDGLLLTSQFAGEPIEFKTPFELKPIEMCLKKHPVVSAPPRSGPLAGGVSRLCLLCDRNAFGAACDLPMNEIEVPAGLAMRSLHSLQQHARIDGFHPTILRASQPTKLDRPS